MNQMHLLRRFVEEYKDGDKECFLTAPQAQEMALAIARSLKVSDSLWETFAGRKLTDKEKGLAQP